MGLIKSFLTLAVVGLGAAGAFVWWGGYNVAADDPHWAATYRLMDVVRTRSIAARAADLVPPDLDDEALVREGIGNYSSMCVTCHLAPGSSDTELSLGLYPTPPTWSELGATDPREAFWVIKHGVKMSGMPAWGKSMDDRYIWGMVAALQRFPRMTAADYKALVAASPGHSHGGGETNVRGGAMPESHGDMPAHDAPRSSFEPIEDPMAPAADEHDGDNHTH